MASDEQPERWMGASDIQNVYASYGPLLHRLEPLDRLTFGRFRRQQFADVSGSVLDVACGPGTNFPYLDPGTDLVGIDISPEMLSRAQQRLNRLNLDGSLLVMDAERMSFSTNSFDTVISALSTCTFPDPVAALAEMQRVCRPDGRILLVEHARSTIGPVARFQEWIEDAHYRRMGCRWTQEPHEHVRAAGLPILAHETALGGIIRTMEIAPSDYNP